MPKKVSPLTDSKIKSTKVNLDKDIRLSDGDGLNLIVRKNGTKLWRFDYTRPISKKRNTISIGNYPEVTLAQAREQREYFRSLLAQNLDPQAERNKKEEQQRQELEYTFRIVAEEYIQKQELAPNTVKRNAIIFKYIYEAIGDMPISQIKAKDLVKAIGRAESRDTIDTAKRIRSKASQVFRYAVRMGLCERDIAQDLIGTIKQKESKHFAALTKPEDFARLLIDIDGYAGNVHTKYALKIAPHVFVRIGELRNAKWQDIDFDKKIWSYTPPKTQKKTGTEHIVPLSKQVLQMLKDLQGHAGRSEYVFPSMTTPARPMSDMTINMALRRMGYGSDEMVGHGFRAIARTLLEEVLKFKVERIEQQLAHQVRDMHGRAYNRTRFLDERAEMMQAWSDYIDSLKAT